MNLRIQELIKATSAQDFYSIFKSDISFIIESLTNLIKNRPDNGDIDVIHIFLQDLAKTKLNLKPEEAQELFGAVTLLNINDNTKKEISEFLERYWLYKIEIKKNYIAKFLIVLKFGVFDNCPFHGIGFVGAEYPETAL